MNRTPIVVPAEFVKRMQRVADLLDGETIMMDDDQLVKLLKAIIAIAKIPYPYPVGSDHNPYLVMALGEIQGVAMKALAHVPSTGVVTK